MFEVNRDTGWRLLIGHWLLTNGFLHFDFCILHFIFEAMKDTDWRLEIVDWSLVIGGYRM
jgi:hypothetical protein